MGRVLAHIEIISNIKPIENADNIALATILGWQVIVKKNEFKVGDKCVYIEIDSLAPKDDERFAFLESKNYKIKTMKLGKKFGSPISQGLALPLTEFPEIADKDIGTDVTDTLKITYYSADDRQRKSNKTDPNAKYKSMAARHPKLAKKKWFRWMMKKNWGKKLLFLLLGNKKDKPLTFPTKFEFINKTDEERCENLNQDLLFNYNKPLIQTLKVDGTSSTYILERKRFNKFEFYVCSRNIRQLTPDQKCYHKDNVYWEAEYKYHIRDFLQKQLENHPEWNYVCLQGEIAGENIQGNPHKLKGLNFFGFNFIDSDNGRWNSIKSKTLCESYGIPWVPIISENYYLPSTIEELKLEADGNCDIPGSSGLREGFVYRGIDDVNFSFKNVSRQYLIKKGE